MITKDILASVYVVLDNASESELDLSIALEIFASTLTMMKYEQIFGNLDDVIKKSEVVFSDTTGIVNNSLTDFGDVVFLKFNSDYIDECPVSRLEEYANAGMQRVAFWTDAADPDALVNKIQLAIPQMGTLQVWHEPYTIVDPSRGATLDLHESLKYCLVFRIAMACVTYVKFKDELKMLNKPSLQGHLMKQAEDWKQVYLEKINRIGTNKPFTRIPFIAG